MSGIRNGFPTPIIRTAIPSSFVICRAQCTATFIEDAQATLTALASFFRLGDGSLDWATAAKGPLFQEHAKERGRVFNKDHYLAQRDETPAAHADEFNAALRWGCDLTERHDVSLAWDETLLRMGAAN